MFNNLFFSLIVFFFSFFLEIFSILDVRKLGKAIGNFFTEERNYPNAGAGLYLYQDVPLRRFTFGDQYHETLLSAKEIKGGNASNDECVYWDLWVSQTVIPSV